MTLIVVLLPQPEGPKSATTPGVGSSNRTFKRNDPQLLLGRDAQHQRPIMRRTRRANHSDTSNPPSPSTTERTARRAAA